VSSEAFSADLLEHGRRGCTGHRIASEGSAQATRSDGVHQLAPACDAGEWQPAAKRFSGNQEVWLDAVVLDRPDGTGPAHTCLDLVVHVQDPVRRADFLE